MYMCDKQKKPTFEIELTFSESTQASSKLG